jgi:RNA polymerase sigma-70 factor, ECF subfamily
MQEHLKHENETRGTERGGPHGLETADHAHVLVELVQRVSGGDRDALGGLYDLTVARLFALARIILRNTSDAEEVVCDVYTQVWQSAAEYRIERGAVMHWLLMLCRSRALDRLRRNRVRAQAVVTHSAEVLETEAQSLQAGPEDILDHIQQGTAVHRALETLTPVRRQLISLAFFKGLSHVEIAAECGLPVGTVKSHIRRALTTLRVELVEGGAHVPASG